MMRRLFGSDGSAWGVGFCGFGLSQRAWSTVLDGVTSGDENTRGADCLVSLPQNFHQFGGTMSHLDSGFAGGDEDTPKTHTPLAAKAPRIVGHDMS